jgi:very-short-patch-repair endonuclease
MSFIEQFGDLILKEYNENEKSIEQIATGLNTYPNKVRRTLIKLGAVIRSRSESQKIALEQGRSTPPMLGKTHSEQTKNKIGDGVHKNWSELTDSERQERTQKAKDAWEAMSLAEREEFQRAGHRAIREASREGSKMEKYLANLLTDNDYEVIIHKKQLIENVNLEIDLLIPELNVAIEVDGPSHFFPIWGEESLQRNIKADTEKSALLLNGGYCIIRVKDITTTTTKRSMRIAGEKLLVELEKIEKKRPSKGKRLIEVEVE